MGRYSFNHVTYDVIRYVHDNIVNAIQNAQSNLGQKQQQINEILQTSGLQGPDIDAYRTQLSDSWAP
jgi:hypothetical protein